MTSKSKVKGNSFERECAKFLSELYGESFIRNISGSGAYVGGSNGFRKQFLTDSQIRHSKGDIVPPDSFSKLNAECKSYADFAFHQLFTGNNKTLESWINQCVEVADTGDVNVVFFKITRKGTFVALQQSDNQSTVQSNIQATNHLKYTSAKHGTWTIMDFDQFFSLNSEVFKTLCKGSE